MMCLSFSTLPQPKELLHRRGTDMEMGSIHMHLNANISLIIQRFPLVIQGIVYAICNITA
jgi:hypothetical protein